MNTPKEKFIMRICNQLLIKIRMNGIDPTEASVFFGDQAQQMLACTPNYGPGSNKVTTAKQHQLKKDVWLMRGFYPATAQMFKISIFKNEEHDAFGHAYEYYVKVSEPKIRVPTNRNKDGFNGRGLKMSSRNESTLTSNQVRDQLQERLEREVLGLDLDVASAIQKEVVFTPKCLSPKGMKKFTLDLKKG